MIFSPFEPNWNYPAGVLSINLTDIVTKPNVECGDIFIVCDNIVIIVLVVCELTMTQNNKNDP